MEQRVPDRLYKYQSLTAQTLAALKVRTIWFSRPSRLNDPFDCAIPWQLKQVTEDDCARILRERTDPDILRFREDRKYVDAHGRPTSRMISEVQAAGRKVFEDAAASMYEGRGVTCFSEVPDSTLLWSHYGGAHKGICLEFDTSSPLLHKLYPIRYANEVPSFDVVETWLSRTPRILDFVLTKAACWSYEREWRAIHREPDMEYCYGVEALTGVYLGAALSDAERDLVCHILHGTPSKIFRVDRGAGSFNLEIRTVEYTPYRHEPPVAL